jgi:hypothetical protein
MNPRQPTLEYISALENATAAIDRLQLVVMTDPEQSGLYWQMLHTSLNLKRAMIRLRLQQSRAKEQQRAELLPDTAF